MGAEPTLRYPTLRRTRTTLRVLAPIVSTTALLTGIALFAGVAPRLVSLGYGVYERLIWAAIALGYLVGAPVAGFVLFFLLRAAADLIDLWIDSEVAAEKSADLVERQLVPGVLRMCHLLEKTNETLTGPNTAKVATNPEPKSVDVMQQAAETVREAVRREAWDQARRLAGSVAAQHPNAAEARDLAAQVEAAFNRKVSSLREQLDQAERSADPETLMNVRDRLSAYLDGTHLYQIDRRVAHWMSTYLREALAEGRAKEVVHLAERVADAFGESTIEGGHVRTALPTLRRSAGLCPDCGQPYDVSLVRCAACESKRTARTGPVAAATRP